MLKNKTLFILIIFIISIVFLFSFRISSVSAYIDAELKSSTVTNTLEVIKGYAEGGIIFFPSRCSYMARDCPSDTIQPASPCGWPFNKEVKWSIVGTSKNGVFKLTNPVEPCGISCAADVYSDEPCCESDCFCGIEIDCGISGCIANPWSGDFSSNIDVSSLAAGNYTIRIWTENCSINYCDECSINLPFTIIPPTCTLLADPSSIVSGGSSTLTWSSTNANSCSATSPSGWTTSTATSGTKIVSPTLTTTYNMTCFRAAGGSGSCSRTVNVSTTTPTCTILADDPSIVSGDSTTLRWSSTNATACSAIWTTSTATSGNKIVSPTSTTTYNMTCTGTGGSGSCSRTVNVSTTPTPTCTLLADPSSIVSGGSSTLTWSSTNATACSATWTTSTATSGTKSVSPTSTTTYNMTCTGTGGSGSCSKNVTVSSIPTLSVGLTANPSSGPAPFNSNLTANVGGTATGPINYYFDCTNDGIWNETVIGTNEDSYTSLCNYPSAITYTAKVKVERGGLTKTATTTINADSGVDLSCTVEATPSYGPPPLNVDTIEVKVGGTNTGRITYRIDCTDYLPPTWDHVSDPIFTNPYTVYDICNYPTAGTYRIKVRVNRTVARVCNADIVVAPNLPPNVPTPIAPPHNIWINYNPTFQANVSDPNTLDTVRAIFQVTDYGAGAGSFTTNPGTSSWGPVAIPDGEWPWLAYGLDNFGLNGSPTPPSGYWLLKKDTVPPTATLDQENGVSPDTSISVNLNELDNPGGNLPNGSGIAEGDVDVSINGGAWSDTGLPNNGSTMDNFTYTGVNNSCYEFRYRVKDNAGNWSGYSLDGQVCVSINNPPTATCNDAEIWNYCLDSRHPTLEWNYSDPDGDAQASYQVQADETSNFSSVPLKLDTGVINSSSNRYPVSPSHILRGTDLVWNTKYYWQVKVKDSQGNWSGWCPSACSFTTPFHAYPSPDFTRSPQNPSAEENVTFTDTSKCYDDIGTDQCTKPNDFYSWTFTPIPPTIGTVNWDANLGDARTLESPVVSFSSPGSWDVTLEVTDSTSFKCSSAPKSVKVSLPLPEWKEIIPR